MKATIDLDGVEVTSDCFRVLEFNVGTPKNPKKIWRWVVNVEINGFKIIKRSNIEMHSKEQALKNAQKHGIILEMRDIT